MFLFALQFMEVLQRELDAVEKDKDEFLHDFSAVIVSIMSATTIKISSAPCKMVKLLTIPLQHQFVLPTIFHVR
jgi:hypothetical protein